MDAPCTLQGLLLPPPQDGAVDCDGEEHEEDDKGDDDRDDDGDLVR